MNIPEKPRFARKMIDAWSARLGGIGKDERGNVLATFAVSLFTLIGAVGLGIDTTRAVLVKDRLQRSLDAAGLAAGSALDPADIIPNAQDYFAVNFASVDGVAALSAPLDIQVNPDNSVVTLTATTTVQATFLAVFGFDDITVSASTVVARETRGMELSLVLDMTGSMRSAGKINALKSAASDLLDILYGSDETVPNLWVSVVPYVASVNIGATHSGWLAAGDRALGAAADFDPDVWDGCVEARAAPFDQNDDPPAFSPFTSYYYASNTDNTWPPLTSGVWNNRAEGPNMGCADPIVPLRPEKTEILNAINAMDPPRVGGTTGNLGLVWGWRTLSPDWRGLWGGATPPDMPLDYDEPQMDKVVVVLTDGKNQFAGTRPRGSDYTAHGRLNDFGYFSKNAARAELDFRTSVICDAMKNEDIIIYAITFGNGVDAAAKALWEGCATQPAFYFDAPNNAELQVVFQTIGSQLSNLRISG